MDLISGESLTGGQIRQKEPALAAKANLMQSLMMRLIRSLGQDANVGSVVETTKGRLAPLCKPCWMQVAGSSFEIRYKRWNHGQ